MGMGKIFDEALEALDSIDFYYHEKSRDQCLRDNHPVSRGFLGAYDLTEGKYPILLKKATEVADMLYGAFDTRNRMPQTRWQWTRSKLGLSIQPSENTILAELGSLDLEFTRLSQLTNDSKYFDTTQRITDNLKIAQKQTKLPGLWPATVDAHELRFSDDRFTVGGMADSTYKYLVKEHILLGAQTDQYRDMYDFAMEGIKKHLLFRGMVKGGSDVLFAGNAQVGPGSSKGVLESQTAHLKCFLILPDNCHRIFHHNSH